MPRVSYISRTSCFVSSWRWLSLPSFRACAACSTSGLYFFSRFFSWLAMVFSSLPMASSFAIAPLALSVSPSAMALYSRSYCPVALAGREFRLSFSPYFPPVTA